VQNKVGISQYIKDKISSTQFFKTTVNGSTIVACFGDETYGELTKFMQRKHKADVSILINTKINSVKMTKLPTSTFNFIKLAFILDAKVQNNVATCEINEKVLQFTKRLVLC